MKLLVALLTLTSLISQAQNPNDCVNAIVLCGNSNIGLDPNGIGINEFDLPGNTQPSCYFFDQHNIWFKIEIAGAGTLTFDLIPDDGIADYDFAIFGPQVTCTTLGESIRCSSTNPENAGVSADTGLNMTEVDVNEGPGEDGNGYLKFIDAQVGEVYYLLVDRAVGDNGFSLNLTGTATLPQSVFSNPVENLIQCDTDAVPDGFTDFNLDNLIPTIIGTQTDVTVTFHENLNDANIGINELSSPYHNSVNPQTIYTRIESLNGCADSSSFTIETGNPILMTPADIVICGYLPSEEFILDTIIPEIIIDPTGYLFTYFNSQDDAETNTNPITSTTVLLDNIPRTIYVRVTDENDALCYNTTSFNGYSNQITPATQPDNIVVCDDNFDEIVSVTLADLDNEILNGLPATDFEINYYSSQIDRETGSNSITGVYENTSNPKTIFIKFEEIATSCFDHIQIDIIVNPLPLPKFNQDPYTYCLNATEPLAISVQNYFNYHYWSTGEQGYDTNEIGINSPGTYSVTVSNVYGCTNSISTTVLESNTATINEIIIEDFNDNNSATIIVEGEGDYEFALGDSGFYKDSNIFTGLTNNYYTIYVRDKNGCGVVSKEFIVLDYPKFFTPNGDGHHDTWNIIGISDFPFIKIYIFDRFGKLLKQIKSYEGGWDGYYNGNLMPSNDYWFKIEMEDARTIKGHFTLKR